MSLLGAATISFRRAGEWLTQAPLPDDPPRVRIALSSIIQYGGEGLIVGEGTAYRDPEMVEAALANKPATMQAFVDTCCSVPPLTD